MTVFRKEKLLAICDAIYYDEKKDKEIDCDKELEMEFSTSHSLAHKRDQRFQKKLKGEGWKVDDDRTICPECQKELEKDEVYLI